MKKFLLFFAFSAVFCCLSSAAEAPRFIFLFLAEGMDGRLLSLGRQAALHSGSPWFPEGLDEQNKRLAAADSFGSGRARTGNADGSAADSESAATAIACGVKTKKGYLGADPDQKRLKSLAVLAKEAGRKVALLSTGPINRGPSAAFFAHVADGSKAGQIALEMHLSGIDFFGGEALAGSALEREIAEDALKHRGYSVLYGERDLISYNGTGKIFCRTSGRLNAQERASDKDSVSLARQVESVLSIFGDQDGFFILVEGSGIGGEHGAGDTAALLAELDEFNEALGKAFDFEKKHPSGTLILVTSTHGAGRLNFLSPDGKLTADQVSLIRAQTSPVSAIIGELTKIAAENRKTEKPEESFPDVLRTAREALGLPQEKLTPGTIEKLTGLWEKTTFDPHAFLSVLLDVRDRLSGVGWTREIRRENDVFVTAFGVGAALFNGTYDNTELFRKLADLAFSPARSAEAGTSAPAGQPVK